MRESTNPALVPDDVYNRALLESSHPPGWRNPRATERYNLVVVGAGTAGLVSAAGAAGLGAKVALVERHLTGGDCLVYGCVPSKSLLRAARAAHAARVAQGGDGLGVHAGSVRVDFGAVMNRMRRLRAEIAPVDSVQRFAALGVDVFLGDARFVAPDEIAVDGQELRFARAIVATGARAATPEIPGLAEAGFLTNETVFSLVELPRRLVVIGGGPLGCELAQAFRRFGSDVTLLQSAPRLVEHDDADAAAILADNFRREGIAVRCGARIVRVEQREGARRVIFRAGTDERGAEQHAEADAILVAAGRAPNVDGLGLEAAGIEFDEKGVQVDDRLRTTNARVFAAGDVCSDKKFTHAADAMARIALQNALFPRPIGRRRASTLRIPWCTYTDPEIAHVGLDLEAAAKQPGVATAKIDLREIDRALLDDESEGFVRVAFVRKSGRILGATIVAAHAGEMIGEVALAMTAGAGLPTLARTIHPYPTQAEALKRLGDEYVRSRFTPRLRSFLVRYFRWRR